MISQITIQHPDKLLSLNKFIELGRVKDNRPKKTKKGYSPSLGSIMQGKSKKDAESFIRLQIATMKPIEGKYYYLIVHYEKDMRKDADNIQFRKKYIFDALQKSNKIQNDSRKFVVIIGEPVLVDKLKSRIDIYYSADKNELFDYYINEFKELM